MQRAAMLNAGILETELNTDEVAGIYKYRQVDDRLSTSGQPSVEQLTAIANAGFQVIINLALHDDPRYALPDEQGVVNRLGLKYVHIPVQFAKPEDTDLQVFFDAMNSTSNQKVWIHCAANIRVTAFLGLYRVIKQGWKQDDAFSLMRGIWEPDAVWSAFINNAIARTQA